jgi:hypothetical protein
MSVTAARTRAMSSGGIPNFSNCWALSSNIACG